MGLHLHPVLLTFATYHAAAHWASSLRHRSDAQWLVPETNATSVSTASFMLDRVGQDCTCKFQGTCSCEGAIEFMICIKNACISGQCHCDAGEDNHFFAACHAMDTTCPVIGLQCQPNSATCGQYSVGLPSPTDSLKSRPSTEHTSKDVARDKGKGNDTYGIVTLFGFVTVVVAFAMAASADKVFRKSTLAAIDHVTVTIIGSALFYIIYNIIDSFGHPPHYQVLQHVVYAVVSFMVALYGSWYLRKDPLKVETFNAVMFYIVMLGQKGAANKAQVEFSNSLYGLCLGTMITLVAFALMIFISHLIKPELAWFDAEENKIFGGALAAAVTLLVNFAISGHEHPKVGPDVITPDHGTSLMILLFAVSTVVAAILGSPALNKVAKKLGQNSNQYWGSRALQVLSSFLSYMPHFTVGVGIGIYVCSVTGFHSNDTMAHLVTLMVNSMIGLALILCVAFIPYLKNASTDVAKDIASWLPAFGGFIIGGSWSKVLCGSVEHLLLGQGLSVEQELQVRIFILMILLAILLPVYAFYWRPVVTELTK